LVDAGRLVRALELHHPVDIDPGLAGVGFLGCPDHDARRIDLVDKTGSPRRDGGARSRDPDSMPVPTSGASDLTSSTA
jgi:hypothetical protein